MHLDAGNLQGVHHTRKKLDLSEEGEHRRMLTEIVVKVSDEVVVGCELADTQVSGQKSFGMPGDERPVGPWQRGRQLELGPFLWPP